MGIKEEEDFKAIIIKMVESTDLGQDQIQMIKEEMMEAEGLIEIPGTKTTIETKEIEAEIETIIIETIKIEIR